LSGVKEILSADLVSRKITELADKLLIDYQFQELVVVAVLPGAQRFAAELVKAMRTSEMEIVEDSVEVHRSGHGQATMIGISKDNSQQVYEADVLIVDDILETGKALTFLKKHFEDKGASSVKLCALLDKPDARKEKIAVDYLGFEVPNKPIVGYGISQQGQHQELQYIGIIE
jgi:hypoxanthine phosphoribosyltransferase